MAAKRKVEIDRSKALLDFSVQADYETVSAFVDTMNERYSFLSVTSIGETILGKKIFMLSLGNRNAAKSVLYVASHHGAEWITTLILLRFVNEVCEYYKAGKQPFGVNMQALLSARCIHVVPLLNADGVDIQINGVSEDCILYDRLNKMSGGNYSMWKANARGVDLNHNYDAGFYEYKKLESENGIVPGATRYGGEAPFSEPETGALANYIRYDEAVGMVISLHTSGNEIYYSSGGYAPKGALSIARRLARLSGYKLSQPEGLAAYGGLTDWFIKEFDRPSFTVECGKDKTPISERKYFELYASVREMLMCAPVMI
ncbi:MAG: gamma-D-glutamyl-meso-diaminopimelate peptidase [Ruminococcaceae bacterium]|nr:gamma-D-glutamyl-meso-diaminopimelate peptidase [Oscillospiraceae bacterium]